MILNAGKVIEIFSAKKGQSGLPRPKVNELNLVYQFGIEGDKFAGKDENKAIMIVGKDSYNLALENGIKLEYGSLGENILLDFDPHKYTVGTKFKIGDSIIEIMENCTICNHLSIFGKKLPILLKECRGLYCKIKVSGKIIKGSTVKIVEEKVF